MILYLLLAALQADVPLDPPPLKIKPVTVTNPSPTVTKPSPAVPNPTSANPTIIYTPAPKAAPAATPVQPQPEPEPTPELASAPEPSATGLSAAVVKRILAERQANVQRQAAYRRELQAAQDAVTRALAAEPFDLDALRTALVNRDRVTTAYREQVTAAVVTMLNEVPAGERLAVAKAVIQGEGAPRAAAAPPAKPDPKPSPVGR